MSPLPCILLALTQSPAPAPLPKVEELLARREAALGEAAARAKIARLTITGSVSVPGMPAEGRFEERYEGERARWDTSWPGMTESTQGTTGAWSWSTDPALGITIREGAADLSLRRMYGLARSAPWSAHYARAELVGRAQVGGVECFELRMVPKQGKPDTWFLDAASAEVRRADLELPDPNGGVLPLRYLLSDYRKVDGVAYPHARQQQIGEFTIHYQAREIAHPKELAAAKLAPPEPVQRAFEDPARRSQEKPVEAGVFRRETRAAQPFMSIRARVKASEISKELAVMLPEVMAAVLASGGKLAGPPSSRYHAFEGEFIDLEAGMAVEQAVAGKGRVLARELPAGEVAVGWHIGAYHELSKSHKLLEQWIAAQGLVSRGGMWEVYWTDPGLEPDMAKWRTELVWPVQEK